MRNALQRVLALSQHRAYPIVVAGLVALDHAIWVVPNDILIVSAALAQPKRWFSTAILVSLGSTLGAFALYEVMQFAPDLISRFFPEIFSSPAWSQVQKIFAEYGSAAGFVGAIGPVPLQVFVIVGGMTKGSATALIGGIFVGRVIKYCFYCAIAAKAPQLLGKFGLKA